MTMMLPTAVKPGQSIELGGEKCTYEKWTRMWRFFKSFCWWCVIGLFVFAISWIVVGYLEKSKVAERVQLVASAVQAQGDAKIKQGMAIVQHARAVGVPCLSSGHVFDFKTQIVAYSDGRMMYEPAFLRGEDITRVREHNQFCKESDESVIKIAKRFKRIWIQTQANPDGIELAGEDAFCMQACLDVLKAKNICGNVTLINNEEAKKQTSRETAKNVNDGSSLRSNVKTHNDLAEVHNSNFNKKAEL